ncbi:ribosome-associated ATPase/putative transporter RbbA (plasmid) [Rhizobium sullae]|uniref:Ribosome-associated ATPase/putative transporter RbbA n=1 Tax=Rhizobium sullae TaxID=50338 RepID=A0ABY5XVN3_RHISU|nr:ribosome-associated ATPase/putative transporter RbbA [Rhizobium sullae]UWU18674.1 ribosome-associated ATPase/putative transporter RbbA [Rhizobium sullae]
MSEPAVCLGSVTHRYGKITALDDVELAIPAGCMAGLIGPDGVGKSTLLGLAAGVTKIQQGQIEVLGGDMARASHRRAVCGRIAYMPQGLGRNLYPTLSVAENLDFFGRLFGQDGRQRRSRMDELLRMTGLLPFRDRLAGKLSGGMKQKLGICASLLHDPDLLILDEPTTGIDPLSRRQFWELIDRIRQRRPNMSVIVATAYMEEAARFDWLSALHGGRLIATGSPADIMNRASRKTLEAAFTTLMPGSKAAKNAEIVIVPWRGVDGPPAIEAEGLTCRFGDFVAVNHVSFRISKGEIFGFLGSNGSGKSTTMKMLTGLLPASEGSARLFGQVLEAGDIETRKRVGYMSQAFSLYGELTVRQNLLLHARLFGLPAQEIEPRLAEMLSTYDLKEVADQQPQDLPLGIRQRLQLAAAVIHRPEILILDEPTSGVDPVARDAFWRSLITLSRRDGVTIFLSTHFMNEAERCDRISLMHEGKVLAIGAPRELCAERGSTSLEQTFIDVLTEAGMGAGASREIGEVLGESAPPPRLFDPRRLLAYARRETLEILRDHARLVFALLGPVILLLTFGYGISFDVEHLPFAVYDQDQSAESRQLVENLQGSRYFDEHAAIGSATELEARLKDGELTVAIEIPPDFGRNLMRQTQPEVSVWLDGAMPFRAETARSYITGLIQAYLSDAKARHSGRSASPYPVSVESRFRYNQAFKSANAIVPSVIVLMLVLIPAIMAALGIVKEKETGSIANFQATPVTRIEFLLGKQLPYAAIAFLSFLMLAAMTRFVFGVPIKGSLPLLVAGSVLYVLATTGFGLLVSSFVRSQVAAIFATAIITMIPAVNFSGLLVPVSSLSGGGRLMGLLFPAAWYQPISVGVITKGLGFAELWFNLVVLAAFGLVFVAAALAALRKRGA